MEGRLGRWLKPFLDRLGHKARRQMCPLYVSGLIGPGDRKSIQPMAERLALGEYDQLHHFIAAGVWDSAPVETELLVQADRLVGGSDAVLVIDDTAIAKKGAHSVGVAPQYASALGKTANCQTLVSLTLARGEVPVMLALRLFLPESWTSKRARLERAGVPTEYRTARTKPEMALAEIDRVIAAGVRLLCAGGYGLWDEYAVPPWAHSSQTCLGRRYSASPQSVPCRCADDLARCWARPSPYGTFLTFYRSRPKTCWATPHGRTSVGERVRKESSGPLHCHPLAHSRRATAANQETRATNICQERRPGSSANTGCRERRNTISPTCRRRPTCAP